MRTEIRTTGGSIDIMLGAFVDLDEEQLVNWGDLTAGQLEKLETLHNQLKKHFSDAQEQIRVILMGAEAV